MKLLSEIDMFGYQPTMMIENSKSLNSPIGTMLSLLIIITVLLSIWIFGNDLIFKLKPNVITTNYADPSPLRTEFNNENYIITFGGFL